MTSFSELGLAAPILKALADENHTVPTPIQANAIPAVMAGRDLLGIAQTGTGKTAAFALPILHRLATHPRTPSARRCRILVLSPTRELSAQIRERFTAYGRNLPIRTALVIGGVAIGGQARSLAAGVDILVATPGRLIDLIGAGAVRLDEVEVLVLDEADRMLDMGFIHAIRRIAALLPKARQSLFFSATMPAPIAALAKALLDDPATVAVTPVAATADRVEQRIAFVAPGQKLPRLVALLSMPAVDRVLVFARTKRGADKVVRGLAQEGVAAEAIHGNKNQSQRERALAGFRNGRVRVLVATDIAARGIDVPAVTHVVNYDLPNEPESYVHRIGRTARAGAAGIAISLCTPEERPYLAAIEKLTKQRIAELDGPSSPEPRPASGRPASTRQPVARTPHPRAAKPAARKRRRRAPGKRQEPGSMPKWLLA